MNIFKKSRWQQSNQMDLFANQTPNKLPPLSDESIDQMLISIMALESIRGIGFKTVCNLLDAGFLNLIWQANLTEIEQMFSAILINHKTELAKEVFENRNSLLENGSKKAILLSNNGIHFIPKGFRHYPLALMKLKTPPRWIFVKGNFNTLQVPGIIGVIGTRDASPEGIRFAYTCARELVQQNMIILSGLAKGIDESAQKGAIDHYGQTIGVLGHGLSPHFEAGNEYFWNQIIERDGTIISEYLPDDPPSREGFLRRNELQAALSRVIIPIECPSLNSGTGSTIRRAMSLETPVLGIFPETLDKESLRLTKKNLEGLGFRVFFSPSHTKDFWDYLRNLIPDHQWDQGPRLRQQRLIDAIQKDLGDELRKASFDDQAIDQLSQSLKKELKVGKQGKSL